LDLIRRIQATPIPGGEIGAEEREHRNRLIAQLRLQDARSFNVALQGSLEGALLGLGIQVVLALLLSGGRGDDAR
jgi:hypothetical protein